MNILISHFIAREIPTQHSNFWTSFHDFSRRHPVPFHHLQSQDSSPCHSSVGRESAPRFILPRSPPGTAASMASPFSDPSESHYSSTPDDNMMVDPFEVRMRFTTQLQHLSASVTSSQKAAHYALKYRDLDEDLHSCILEQLERVSRSKS